MFLNGAGMSNGKIKAARDAEVERFERNMIHHGLYLYRCEGCGRIYGRYIEERVTRCLKCKTVTGNAITVVEPETFICAMVNNRRGVVSREK
jgi:hypothetical protein